MKLVFVFLMALCAFAAARPNFVIILADDLGVNDVDWNYHTLEKPSYPAANTPHLRQMAVDGKLLNRTYGQPLCCPSRAALNSGLWPTHPDNGVFLNDGSARDNAVWNQPQTNEFVSPCVQNFAQTLQADGYHTASIGKYRTDKNIDPTAADYPLSRGYDIFAEGGNTTTDWRYYPLDPVSDPYLGTPYTNAYTQAEVERITDFQSYYTLSQMEGFLLGEPKHLTDALEQMVEDTITSFVTTYPNDQFLVYWAPHAPHGPFLPRQDLVDYYSGNTRVGLIEGLDQAIGRLLDFLVQNNLDADTMVLFMSDNGAPGGYASTELSGSKGSYKDGGIRTTAVAWQPGTVPSGALASKLIHFVDLHATLADLAGVSSPPATDGISFKDILIGQTPTAPRTEIFYHAPVLSRAQSSAYEFKYKIVWDYDTELWSIYDMVNNALENTSTNLTFSSLNANNRGKIYNLCLDLLDYLTPTRDTALNWITWKSTGEKLDLPSCDIFNW